MKRLLDCWVVCSVLENLPATLLMIFLLGWTISLGYFGLLILVSLGGGLLLSHCTGDFVDRFIMKVLFMGYGVTCKRMASVNEPPQLRDKERR